MKLFVKIICIILTILLTAIFIIWFNNQIEIQYKKNGTYEDNLVISFKHRFLKFGQHIECKLSNESTEIKSKMINKSCILSVPQGTYNLILENKNRKLFLTNKEEIVISKIEQFEIEQEKLYLIVDEEHYYVAESNVSTKGVVVNTYTKPELIKNYTYIHLMDEIYKEDGNLTMMW